MRRVVLSLLALGLMGLAGCYHLAGICDCEGDHCNCPPWVGANGAIPSAIPAPLPPPPAPASTGTGR
jgi:hypothetical protein